MIKRGWGRIIFISTSLDIMMAPAFIAYGMSKACDEAYAAALAVSLHGTGVTANVLLPGGPVATRMANSAGTAKGLLPPDVMAPPILWLASDASDQITGRRFIAARWNSALTDAQAAQAAGAPAAWGGSPRLAVSGRRGDADWQFASPLTASRFSTRSTVAIFQKVP